MRTTCTSVRSFADLSLLFPMTGVKLASEDDMCRASKAGTFKDFSKPMPQTTTPAASQINSLPGTATEVLELVRSRMPALCVASVRPLHRLSSTLINHYRAALHRAEMPSEEELRESSLHLRCLRGFQMAQDVLLAVGLPDSSSRLLSFRELVAHLNEQLHRSLVEYLDLDFIVTIAKACRNSVVDAVRIR